MPRQQDPEDRFVELARSLKEQGDESETLDHALKMAVDIISGCDEAAVSLIRRGGRIETLNTIGSRAAEADQLQYDAGEGPCLDTIAHHETTLVPNLADEARWPRWSQRVNRDLGFGSALSFQLFTTATDYGALNMYAERADAFDGHDQIVGLAMAAHIAVALASSRQIDNLGRSVNSRTVIGQAMGIVMERYGLDDSRAFRFLQRVSSITNTRLLAVAEHIVTTRRIPEQHTAAG
ncbi:GAF and ANTAR domain-containing protein [Mumia sp. zg.B53]|uniref:GAF and ANTAR domain-containing protein n=1 Tax=unclassified Mumia TaxID=2621872 RepID=UPI001C6E7BA3|nr:MULTISPECIES: GAF and ANTAR domain-containing protein [unclassified Mumia]MBW9205777.1 GAF and ANTAR domain-containing protein [Mumia sp. zg.B17]MBW9208218.1 GAF and ANTAR domain-containing protein [Mumia sp. zg.B21]MBW9216173.1 GAF and ANTAR domain-containing protein [Mumia sp. zg.B53]MDD9350239.1 GAF and ANTAR domain-containing protein [Mumia sp.]